MKKNVSNLFTALFLLLCTIPSLGMLAFGASAAGANEILAAAPRLRERDGSPNAAVLSDFSDYIGDRFFLRQEAVTAWNTLNAALLRSSAAPEVILGTDGWLYYADTLDDYCGRDALSDRELFSMRRTLLLMREYAASRGSAFLFTIAPNKNSLYGEHMPAYTRASGDTSVRKLAALLVEDEVPYLDLFSVFAAQDEALYYRTDSHWTAKGAALAADAILSSLGKDSALFTSEFNLPSEHLGDLYKMLYPAGKRSETERLPAGPPAFTYVKSFHSPTDITIQTSCENRSGNLLVFRDSFGNNLYPYLADAYGSAVFSRLNAYDLTLLDQYNADSLVIELVERNLRYLLRYPPVFPAPERDASPAASDAGMLSATQTRSSIDGFILLRGALLSAPTDDSPLYLVGESGHTWEATPTLDGFTAHLPADSFSSLRLAYYTANGFVSYTLELAE